MTHLDPEPPTDRMTIEAAFGAVLDASRDGILVNEAVRDDGRIVDFRQVVANLPAAELMGHPVEAVLSTSMLELFPGMADTGLFEHCCEVVETGRPWESEYRYDRDGLDGWYRATFVPLGDGVVVAFRDVSDDRRRQLELELRASHDDLTGLPNRSVLHDLVREALGRTDLTRGRVTVLFIDLDRFKVVNDGLGHAVGDVLLHHMAVRLRGALRQGDHLVRFGGDEFVVVMAEPDRHRAIHEAATRLCAVVSEPLEVMGRTLRTTASIGVAAARSAEDDPAVLVRNADAAMYEAKAARGDGVAVFTERLRRTTKDRLELELDLAVGLTRGEVEVHYQPLVDLGTGDIIGAEALARWHHPDRGLVMPEQFLPMAEDSGLVTNLGDEVGRSVIDQARRWLGGPQPLSLTIAVNCAAAQLCRPGWAAELLDALDAAGVAGQHLAVEVTESGLVRDPATARAALEELAEAGVGIGLDDFGTGYSSLSHLRDFPVHAVKIDRSFVAGIDVSVRDRELVAAVIAMARSLGKLTVAEGVETAAQAEVVTELGADFGQGWLWSAALPAGEFAALARSGTAAATPGRPHTTGTVAARSC